VSCVYRRAKRWLGIIVLPLVATRRLADQLTPGWGL